jgi:hypothetical protein
VRAPGYSWSFVDVDHARGGEYRIELSGAERLTVRLSGLAPTDSAELCIARVGEEGEPRHVALLAKAKDCVQVDELPPDTYVVRSTIHRDSGDVRGPCEFVDVRVAMMAQLDMDLGEASAVTNATPSTATTVPVSVALEMPRAWMEGPDTVRCKFWPAINGHLSGESARAECVLAHVNPDIERWSGGVRLQSGSWIMKIAEIPWAQALDVRQSGASVSSVVPAPVDLRVTYHDAMSGAAIDGVALYTDWFATADEHFFSCSSAQSAAEPDAQHLRIAAGAVVIHARKQGYAPKSIVVDALPGMEPVDLALEPACGFRLRLTSHGTRIWVPFRVPVNVHEIDGDGRLVARSSNQIVQEIEVSHPGRYEILPGQLPGFPNAIPICVDVVRGQFTEAYLELER